MPKQAYTREEVRRLLGVSERQIRSWEKQTFVRAVQNYTFSDLLALRTLVSLRKNRIAMPQIRRALTSLRARLCEVENPLKELKIYSEGKRIRVQFAGTKMESVSGQLLLDFDQVEIERLLSFPHKRSKTDESGAQRKRLEAEQWFERGLALEQAGSPVADVIRAYERAIELDPLSAGALVNLGTICFNSRDFSNAERHYRKALEVDPDYALAHFNLGNLYDERGDRAKALTHYLEALRAHAGYADAHYNIALLYQSLGKTMEAVRHWKAYLKIDPTSSWAAIARRELGKLRDSTIVRGRKD